MKVNIIKIGNSKGIRLSKSLLDQYNIGESIELIPEKGQIILKPTAKPRAGWASAFKEVSAKGENHLLIDDLFEDENLEEWN